MRAGAQSATGRADEDRRAQRDGSAALRAFCDLCSDIGMVLAALQCPHKAGSDGVQVGVKRAPLT